MKVWSEARFFWKGEGGTQAMRINIFLCNGQIDKATEKEESGHLFSKSKPFQYVFYNGRDHNLDIRALICLLKCEKLHLL